MASHFRLGKAPLMVNQAVSSTTAYTSDTLHILNLDNINLQIDYTGTPNGLFLVQVSTDHVEDQEGNVLVEGFWVSLPIGTIPASGSADQIIIDINQISAPWMRIKYTNSSGSGTMNMFASGKGLM